jgi:Ser/Thr protein kinase RdoA (MazF antagonist)
MTEIRVENDLAAFLATGFREKLEIQDRIVEGSANFLYRVKSTTGKTYILKHAEPFIKNNPSVAFPAERMDFEAGILLKVASLADNVVQPVQILEYDAAHHNLLMSDGGSGNLKAAYSDPELDMAAVGAYLGKWLASLHNSTADLQFGDNRVAKNIYRWSYNHLAEAQKKYDLDSTVGEEVNQKFGSLIATDDGSVCHGDFWTGNIIVKNNPLCLTVVDWEMSRRGNGATDVAQFAAEAWLLDRFRGARGLLDPFLEAYVRERPLSDKDMQRVFIHFGTHVSYWPTQVKWGSDQETEAVAKLGYEILSKAKDMDFDWLRKSELRKLFR